MKKIYKMIDELILEGYDNIRIEIVEDGKKVELWSKSKYFGRWLIK